MVIEILKPHKLLTVGQVLDIDREYSANLIKKGIAKSLEVEEELVIEEEVTEKN
jgi:hypothetical protein